jgi:hypothetical protein
VERTAGYATQAITLAALMERSFNSAYKASIAIEMADIDASIPAQTA